MGAWELFLYRGLCVLLVGMTVLAVAIRDLLSSIIVLSLMNVVLVVLFCLLRAPDVAMAQAAIGVGLVTAFFVIALSRTGEERG